MFSAKLKSVVGLSGMHVQLDVYSSEASPGEHYRKFYSLRILRQRGASCVVIIAGIYLLKCAPPPITALQLSHTGIGDIPYPIC